MGKIQQVVASTVCITLTTTQQYRSKMNREYGERIQKNRGQRRLRAHKKRKEKNRVGRKR
jgi:hypothetical protein